MEQDDLLRYVVGVLERLGVDYLVTGSTATIYFGEPRRASRATHRSPPDPARKPIPGA